MKNVLTYILAVTLMLSSCTKEELVIVNQPIKIDGKSGEMQAYLAERALEFMKMYRFEKAVEPMGQVTDQEIKNSLNESWQYYLAKAKMEAFVLVTESNDTLYYKHKGTENPSTVTNLVIDYSARSAHQPNTKGKFYGFERYPQLQTVALTSSMATELDGFDKTPNLKQFTWASNRANFEHWYPDEEFKLSEPIIDFSNNSNLTNLTFTLAKISNVIFPSHLVNAVRVNNSVVSNNDFSRIKAKMLTIDRCETESDDLVLTSNEIEGLSYQFGTLKSIDFRNTNLKTLNVNGTSSFKYIISNDKLENLQIANTGGAAREYVLEADKLPSTMKSIYVSPGTVANAEFGHMTGLTNLNFQGDGNQAFSLLTIPASLTTFTAAGFSCEVLDLSGGSSLSTLNTNNVSSNAIKLPSSIKSLTLQSNNGIHKLDLSALNTVTSITRLIISSSSLEEIILPVNLSQGQFTSIASNLRFTLKTGCQFVNKPQWLDQYITYIN